MELNKRALEPSRPEIDANLTAQSVRLNTIIGDEALVALTDRFPTIERLFDATAIIEPTVNDNSFGDVHLSTEKLLRAFPEFPAEKAAKVIEYFREFKFKPLNPEENQRYQETLTQTLEKLKELDNLTESNEDLIELNTKLREIYENIIRSLSIRLYFLA